MVVVMTSDSDSDDCDDSIEGALLMGRMYLVFIHSHASDSSGERLRSLLSFPMLYVQVMTSVERCLPLFVDSVTTATNMMTSQVCCRICIVFVIVCTHSALNGTVLKECCFL